VKVHHTYAETEKKQQQWLRYGSRGFTDPISYHHVATTDQYWQVINVLLISISCLV